MAFAVCCSIAGFLCLPTCFYSVLLQIRFEEALRSRPDNSHESVLETMKGMKRNPASTVHLYVQTMSHPHIRCLIQYSHKLQILHRSKLFTHVCTVDAFHRTKKVIDVDAH